MPATTSIASVADVPESPAGLTDLLVTETADSFRSASDSKSSEEAGPAAGSEDTQLFGRAGNQNDVLLYDLAVRSKPRLLYSRAARPKDFYDAAVKLQRHVYGAEIVAACTLFPIKTDNKKTRALPMRLLVFAFKLMSTSRLVELLITNC